MGCSFLKNIFNSIDYKRCQKNYSKKLAQLKEDFKSRKIKIIFLNDTVEKWQYQSLYDELKNNPNFEIQVLVTVLNYQTKTKMKNFVDYKKEAQKCYDFFKSQDTNVEYAFDFKKNKPINLKHFNPDIIFYEQPWGLFKIQDIKETSKHALACCLPYGSSLTDSKESYSPIFYKTLYKYFIDNEFAKNMLINHGAKEESIIISAHPKLDQYHKPIDVNNIYWKTDKKRIIYAPHFSFHKHCDLKIGTFDKNYKFFLDYAKNHEEFEFVFKPHPRLKEDIIRRKLMTLSECEEYYNQWATLPNSQIMDTSNYFDMFRTSDLLISDCNSFLFEYLLTEKPVIHLARKDFQDYNDFALEMLKGYYEAYDENDLNNYLQQLLVENNDNLKQTRLDFIDNVVQKNQNCAKFIVDYITNQLSGEI